MSADNGIYIATFPIPGNGVEYRVAHCQAIENCEDDSLTKEIADLYRILYFGEAKIFRTDEEAIDHAHQMEFEIMRSDFPILEYGVSHLRPFDRPLLNITRQEALNRLDRFWEEYGKRQMI